MNVYFSNQNAIPGIRLFQLYTSILSFFLFLTEISVCYLLFLYDIEYNAF